MGPRSAHSPRPSRLSLAVLLALLALTWPASALADETCNSPYMGNLIKNQEDYVYVWTLGVMIDPRGVVREIYSTAYLYPEVVVADIETLRLEGAPPAGPAGGVRPTR
jgi:hypothetical protein